MSSTKKRICIIGAGPCGMCAVYQLKLLCGDSVDIKCYEKQPTLGGLWNYTWRTGTDEYGEIIPCSMYRYLWTIGPKEVMEFIDYPFKEHFGKNLPSFVPREIILRYLEGRWTKGKCGDLSKYVELGHVVKSVDYREDTDDFLVLSKELQSNTCTKEIFSHVIVATGNFGVPNNPSFPGINTFPGRVVHSHEFRDVHEYKGLSVLIIGGSFSASDIAIQLIKFKCTSKVFCSSKKGSIGINPLPKGIEDKKLPEKIEGNLVIFKDGSTALVDVIIFCTGYIYYFPFLNGNLQFDFEGKKTTLYPSGLYKGTVWRKGGNNKLFHLGACETFLDFPVYDVQAIWIVKYILGQIKKEPASPETMMSYDTKWQKKGKDATQTPFEMVAFMREFAKVLCQDIDYPQKYFDTAHDQVVRTIKGRLNNLCGYRDECYPSMYTGEMASIHHSKWIDCLDDSVDLYLN